MRFRFFSMIIAYMAIIASACAQTKITPFDDWLLARPIASTTLGPTDSMPVIQGGKTQRLFPQSYFMRSDGSNWGAASGVWPGALGGTGVANTGKTISLGGNLVSGGALITSGTGPTTLAFPNASATFTYPVTSATLIGSDTLVLPAGVTNIGITGGAGHVLQQQSVGGPITSGPITGFDSEWGMVGDGITASGITTTAGSATFGGLSLTAADVGKAIIVPGAGTNGNPLVTTVATTTSFAAVAGQTTSPTTYFAAPGANAPVVTAQSGAGSYVPLEVITLNDGGTLNTTLVVQYTKIQAATIAAAGSGCINGTVYLRGSTGTGNTGIVRATATAGSITSIDAYPYGGYYTVNPTNLAAEPVTGSNCAGVQLALTMGVAIAQVQIPGKAAAAPTSPIAQLSTSGSGTGFTTSLAYTAAGSATYGTDNSAPLTALMASTASPTASLETGTYLFNCGAYLASSAVSFKGDGQDRSVLKLFPYCRQSAAALFTWNQRHGTRIDGVTLNMNYAIADVLKPTGKIAISIRGSDNVVFHNSSIINTPNLWNMLIIGSGAAHGAKNSTITNSYFHNPAPNATPASSWIIGGTIGEGSTGAFVSGTVSDGVGTQICALSGTVSGNDAYGFNYGAGFFSQHENPLCGYVLFANNSAHDSLGTIDTNGTINSCYELHGERITVVGNKGWGCGGDGFRNQAPNSVWIGNHAWNNGFYTITGNGADFKSISTATETASNSTYIGNVSHGGTPYGYYDLVAGGTLTGISLGPNEFRGTVANTYIASTSPRADMQYYIGTGAALRLPTLDLTSLAVGLGALSIQSGINQNNTASGQNALTLTTTGINNTADGKGALASNVAGNNSTATGAVSLNNSTGSNNSGFGGGVAPTLVGGTNNLVAGTSSACDVEAAGTSNTVRLCAGGAFVFRVTGTGTPTTSISTIAGALDVVGSSTSGKSLRATGQDTATFAGIGAELSWTGATSELRSYDRTGAALQPMALAASTLALNLTGNATIAGGTLTGIPAPTGGTDAVNKTYADAIASGIVTHASAAAATTANLTATASGTGPGKTLTNSGAQAAFALDGYSGLLNERFLVKDQTNQADNGIYTLTTVGTGATNWVLTRATDFDAANPASVAVGASIIVVNGTSNNRTQWVETGQGPFTVDTTAVVFSGIVSAASGTVNSGTANQLGYYATTGTAISGLATGNNGVLSTSGAGVPSISATLPAAVQGNITATGTVASGTWAGTAIAVNKGGSGADLSATGGTSQVWKQTTAGGNVTVGQLACADLSDAGTGCASTPGTAAAANTGTSGHTLGYLDTANTFSAAQSFNSGNLLLKGATSGTITLNAPGTAGSNTLTLPAGTTDFSATGGASQVVKQTSAGGALTVGTVANTDISGLGAGVATFLGTPSSANLKTAVTDETGTGGALVFATAPTISQPNIVGTVANDNAAAGSVGELLSASASAVALTTTTQVNVTSIALTAGDWDVDAEVKLNPAATTTSTLRAAGINTVSATIPLTLAIGTSLFRDSGTITTGQLGPVMPLARTRISASGTTTVYCVARVTFATSTMTADCLIKARRIR